MRALVLLSMVLVHFLWSEQQICVAPTAENIGVVNITSDYADSEIRAALNPKSIAFDRDFYREFARDLGAKAPLDLELKSGDAATAKQSILRNIEEYLKDKAFVHFNISGHGLKIPVIQNDKIVGHQWVLPLPSISKECGALISEKIQSGTISVPRGEVMPAEEIVKILSGEAADRKLLEVVQQYPESFIFDTDLQKLSGNRPTSGLNDTCYSGAFGAANPEGAAQSLIVSSTKADEVAPDFYLDKAGLLSKFVELEKVHGTAAASEKVKALLISQFGNLTGEKMSSELNSALWDGKGEYSYKRILNQIPKKKRADFKILFDKLKASFPPLKSAIEAQYKESKKPGGSLSHFFKDRKAMGLADVDKNADGSISLREFLGNLPEKFVSENTPVTYGSGCDAIWFDRAIYTVPGVKSKRPNNSQAPHN